MTVLKSDYRLPSVTKPAKPAELVCVLKAKPDSSLHLSRSIPFFSESRGSGFEARMESVGRMEKGWEK